MKKAPVSKMMSAPVHTVRADEPLNHVVELLLNSTFHHAPVTEDDKLIGMISATDLLRAGSEVQRLDGVVRDLMQTDPVALSPDDDVSEAARTLAQGWFHALPVVEGDRLVGIVTTSDVLNWALT